MVALIGRKLPTISAPGGSSGGLGNAFDRVAAVLADPLTPEIKRQHLRTLERGNVETEALSRDFAAGDINPAMVTGRAIAAGMDPRNLAGYDYFSTTKRYGPESDQSFTSAMAIPGANYGNTVRGTREDFANRMAMQQAQEATKLRVAGQTPENVLVNGAPVIMPREKAYGQRPVLPLAQEQGALAARASAQPGGLAALDRPSQQFIGVANAGTPRNYVKDGVNFITNDGMTDARTGQPLPEGGYLASPQGSAKDVGINQTVQSGLQAADLARQRFKNMLNYTRNIAEKDPTLFGAAGVARNLVQEGVQLAGNVAQMIGAPDIRAAQEKVRNLAIQSAGISPAIVSEMFDPNLPAIVSAANLLAFQGAAALASQSGRDLSDRDLVIMRQVFGDPRSLLESRESFLAKLKTAEDIVDSMAAADKQFQGQSAVPQQPPAAPQPAAPQNKPARIRQNGAEYELQPDGTYR